MNKLLTAFSLLALTACSANHENYYLNDYAISENIQSKSTTEIAFKNSIYARVLTNDEAVEQFGPTGDDYTIVFLQVENIGEDTSYFNFDKALIDNNETGRIKPLVNTSSLTVSKELNLDKKKHYMNPFKKTEMEDNNFAYNINEKVLKDFSLQPNQTQKGFLIFEKLKDPSSVQFTLSSGVSIYTSRVQSIKLDYED